VSFSTEVLIVHLKPKASTMFLPTLLLAAVSFGLAFVADQFSEADYEMALISGAVVVGAFWALPLASYLLSYLKLTDQQLTIRAGFLGLRKRQLPLSELSSIEIQRPKPLAGKVISILTVHGDEFQVRGYARTKLLAAEIEALARVAS
jgi:membrane protein YdbS with pleckstrin-like domain